MMNAAIGGRYSEAIYEIAENNKKVNELNIDLNNFLTIYEQDKEFKNVMNHPLISRDEKKSIIKNIFKDKFDEITFSVIDYILEKDRLSFIKSIVSEYVKIYFRRNNYEEVEATFSKKPTKAQEEKLVKKLEKITGKKIELTLKIDKEIIGGGIVRIGDKIIDGSVKRHFERLKSSL